MGHFNHSLSWYQKSAQSLLNTLLSISCCEKILYIMTLIFQEILLMGFKATLNIRAFDVHCTKYIYTDQTLPQA